MKIDFRTRLPIAYSTLFFLVAVLLYSTLTKLVFDILGSPRLGYFTAFSIFLIAVASEVKRYFEDKDKPDHVVISLASLLEKDCKILNEKLHSPIKLFIDKKIASVFEEIFQEKDVSGKKYFDPEHIPSGLALIIKDADIYKYAKLATYLDKAAIASPQGYVYSTNISLPSKLQEDGNSHIKKHLEFTNQLIDGMIEHTYQIDGSLEKISLPRLLRIQLLCESRLDPNRIINTKGDFIDDLTAKRINENTKLFFRKNHTFVLDVDNAVIKESFDDKKTFEESSICLGDYIIYSDTVVLKWDISSNVLYLMLGKEIVDAYKLLFLLFWKKWKKTSEDITTELNGMISKS